MTQVLSTSHIRSFQASIVCVTNLVETMPPNDLLMAFRVTLNLLERIGELLSQGKTQNKDMTTRTAPPRVSEPTRNCDRFTSPTDADVICIGSEPYTGGQSAGHPIALPSPPSLRSCKENDDVQIVGDISRPRFPGASNRTFPRPPILNHVKGSQAKPAWIKPRNHPYQAFNLPTLQASYRGPVPTYQPQPKSNDGPGTGLPPSAPSSRPDSGEGVSVATRPTLMNPLGGSTRQRLEDKLQQLLDASEGDLPGGRKVYRCPVCGKSYMIKCSLRYHIKVIHLRMHLGANDVECRLCMKRFTCVSALNRHKLVCPEYHRAMDSLSARSASGGSDGAAELMITSAESLKPVDEFPVDDKDAVTLITTSPPPSVGEKPAVEEEAQVAETSQTGSSMGVSEETSGSS